MVEIKKIDDGRILEESQPIIRYMMNNTEVALIHYLEEVQRLGPMVLPDSLDNLIQRIVTDENSSHCMWSRTEGYIAQRL